MLQSLTSCLVLPTTMGYDSITSTQVVAISDELPGPAHMLDEEVEG